jgi:RNA processing factor Prp31
MDTFFHIFLINYLWLFSALLDDLDKELNNYIMRCREWYGWHFPELSKIVSDNLAYAKIVKKMGEFSIYTDR